MHNNSPEEIETTQNRCYHFSLALVMKKEKVNENEQESSGGVCYKLRLSSCRSFSHPLKFILAAKNLNK
jgi:hypothetical protein